MNHRSFLGIEPRIGDRVYLSPDCAVIGDVELGDDSSVWPMAVIRGDVHRIRIGDRCNIQDGAVLHVSHDSEFQPGGAPLTLHNDVSIGHKACLHGCTIHDRVLIGMGVIVMDRAIIEDDVIVGAGSLVPTGKHLESGYLYVGSPVRQVRKLNQTEMDYLRYSSRQYVKLKDRYMSES